MRRRQWHPTPVLLPRKSHGRRSLEGCSPWGCWGSDTTEQLHFHFSLSCIEEGNGNPLQCSCLENPRDGGAWWAAVYGVTQSRTLLKWPSSTSSMWLCVSSVSSPFLFIAEYNFTIYMSTFVYLFSSRWTLELFPVLCSCKWGCCEHSCHFFCVWHMFSCALGKTSRKRMKHLLNVYLIYTFYLPHVLSLTFFISLHYGSEVKMLVAQSCLTLCDPMDCSLPGSSVHRIFQARILEQIAISFSRGSSRPRDQIRVSHIVGRHFTIWATREILMMSP